MILCTTATLNDRGDEADIVVEYEPMSPDELEIQSIKSMDLDVYDLVKYFDKIDRIEKLIWKDFQEKIEDAKLEKALRRADV